MYKSPSLLNTFGLLLGSRVEKQLCADCQKDIKTLKSRDYDPKLSFQGPFLIRREDGYAVVSLPYYDVIVPTDIESIDWTQFLSLTKDGIRERCAALNRDPRSSQRVWYFKGHWHDPPPKDAFTENISNNDPVTLLRKAVNDPCPVVKRFAMAALEKHEQKHD